MRRKKPDPSAAPIDCRSLNALAAIPRDNASTDDHWMLIDGDTVTIKAQRSGEMPTESVVLPKATFDAFVRWYTTGHWRKPRKSRAKA